MLLEREEQDPCFPVEFQGQNKKDSAVYHRVVVEDDEQVSECGICGGGSGAGGWERLQGSRARV